MICSSVYRFRPWTRLQVVLDQFKGATSRILGEARAAKTIPWDADRTALYRTSFLR